MFSELKQHFFFKNSCTKHEKKNFNSPYRQTSPAISCNKQNMFLIAILIHVFSNMSDIKSMHFVQ